MTFIDTPLQGLFEVQSAPFGDERGKFTRLYCEREFAPLHANLHIAQINLSETRRRGTVRGMHYQMPPSAEAKFIRCLRGRVFDVAVDLRQGSKTFLQWHALELNDENDRAIFIPEGFAHGFQSLSDDVQLLYLHTAPWSQPHEAGLRHDDPRLNVRWPLSTTTISARDRNFPLIKDDFAGVKL